MDESAEFELVIGKLYDAALDVDALPLAVEGMTRWLDGDTCHFFALSKRDGSPVLSVSYGLDGGVGPSYAAHYAKIDPRRELAMNLPAGDFICCHEHFNQRMVSSSEFFQDYLLPLGVHYLLGSGELARSQESTVQIGFQRHVGRLPFDASAKSRMARLMPHLGRAATLIARAENLRTVLDAAKHGLDAIEWGMVAIDAQRRVVFANARADLLLRRSDGITLIGRRFSVKDPASDRRLSQAVERVLSTGIPESLVSAAGDLGIDKEGNGRRGFAALCLTIWSLPKAETQAASACRSISGGARLLIFLTTPAQRRAITPLQLTQMFGLTPAEARLAHGLLGGLTADEYRKKHDVSVATVRTHIRAVLAKTGARRQSDLIYLLSRLPPAQER